MGLGNKSHLITNFVDAPHFKKPNGSNGTNGEIAIYVGRLEPVISPDLPIRAFDFVHKEFPQAELHALVTAAFLNS